MSIETTRKSPEATKVNLKTNFSRPRRVNEALPPRLLANPVPRGCMRMKATIDTERRICKLSNKACILDIIY